MPALADQKLGHIRPLRVPAALFPEVAVLLQDEGSERRRESGSKALEGRTRIEAGATDRAWRVVRAAVQQEVGRGGFDAARGPSRGLGCRRSDLGHATIGGRHVPCDRIDPVVVHLPPSAPTRHPRGFVAVATTPLCERLTPVEVAGGAFVHLGARIGGVSLVPDVLLQKRRGVMAALRCVGDVLQVADALINNRHCPLRRLHWRCLPALRGVHRCGCCNSVGRRLRHWLRKAEFQPPGERHDVVEFPALELLDVVMITLDRHMQIWRQPRRTRQLPRVHFAIAPRAMVLVRPIENLFGKGRVFEQLLQPDDRRRRNFFGAGALFLRRSAAGIAHGCARTRRRSRAQHVVFRGNHRHGGLNAGTRHRWDDHCLMLHDGRAPRRLPHLGREPRTELVKPLPALEDVVRLSGALQELRHLALEKRGNESAACTFAPAALRCCHRGIGRNAFLGQLALEPVEQEHTEFSRVCLLHCIDLRGGDELVGIDIAAIATVKKSENPLQRAQRRAL
mmetsp:Transcript_123453/g.348834  ORF Transcript_123453/g.348834 Transcript_123453/m.348834 type:complete len:508 (+) Transcript_123453:1913-3436(+)